MRSNQEASLMVQKLLKKKLGSILGPLSIFQKKITSTSSGFLNSKKSVKIKLKGSVHIYIISPKW